MAGLEPASKKRELEAADAVEALFDGLVDRMEQAGATAWSGADRSKLGALLARYLEAQEAEAHGDESTAVCSVQRRMPLWRFLDRLRKGLRRKVPAGSVTEELHPPEGSELFDAGVPSFEVDAFLYPDDDDVDGLVDSGVVARNFCTKCGSRDVQPTQFISHSFSQQQLVFVGQVLLPMALAAHSDGPFVATDVGSRLGTVVATLAFELRKWGRETGTPHVVHSIEMSEPFVTAQRELLGKENLGDLQFHCLDATKAAAAEILRGSSLVVLNNVFEWFVAEDGQLGVWDAMKAALRGRWLIAYPSLEESLRPVMRRAGKADPEAAVLAYLADWVEPVDTRDAVEAFMMDTEVEDDDEEELAHQTSTLMGVRLYRLKP